MVEVAVLLAALGIAGGSYFIVTGETSPQRLLTPPLVALLLVANLIPWMALLVLLGRRVAMRRAARSPIGGGGRLHVRLVALFSLIASVPLVFVTIFASLLFQLGVEFWYSDRARGILENATSLARESIQQMLDYVDKENIALGTDLSKALVDYGWPIDSPEFTALLFQDTFQRSLSEAIVFEVSPRGEILTVALVNPYERDLNKAIDPASIARLRAGAKSVARISRDRIESITPIPRTELFLYASRVAGAEEMQARARRAQAVLDDYRALLERSRVLQLRFNLALLAISLLILGLAVFVALAVADRLVRPVGELVDAARRVAGGDLTARVPEPNTRDEVATLAGAFNRMTDRLQQQTGALVRMNSQLESRSALIEAVMSGVSAGIISVDGERRIRLINASARTLLHTGEEPPVGRPLAECAPELDALLDSDKREAIVQVTTGGEARTLAVKITRDEAGRILTFDDITQQLLDQRRAAWSDVARRIAHEIKNPLTPIQLAAERLQRRYGKQVDPDDTVFARLTDTIVRQVGDLRRMVDEFSSFARMPKPIFRQESVVDIVRQAVFLHEVAHPDISFELVADDAPMLVCDRRQLGQALTNIVKNAVEAVEARDPAASASPGRIVATVKAGDGMVRIAVEDNGIGLPVERDRIIEPYMTTRSRGTGLGLAIVKKIVEEHFGSITFADRPGGGTQVTIAFDTSLLANFADAGADSDSSGDARPAMLTRSRN